MKTTIPCLIASSSVHDIGIAGGRDAECGRQLLGGRGRASYEGMVFCEFVDRDIGIVGGRGSESGSQLLRDRVGFGHEAVPVPVTASELDNRLRHAVILRSPIQFKTHNHDPSGKRPFACPKPSGPAK